MKTKKELKKQELVELIKANTVDDCLDVSEFRKKHEKEYMLIPHYFGSINKAMEELHIVKVTSATTKKNNNLTLKDLLAYDRLKGLRESGKTFEDIATEYNVSKMLVSKMYRVLGAKVEDTTEKID